MIIIVSIILASMAALVVYANIVYWRTPMTEKERQEERDEMFIW